MNEVTKLHDDKPVHNCGTCTFHDTQPVAMPDGTAVIGKTQMICRRFPPQVVAMQVPSPAGISVTLLPMFPPVNDAMWCYEHEPENGAQDISG
jgi:hypothetical protein